MRHFPHAAPPARALAVHQLAAVLDRQHLAPGHPFRQPRRLGGEDLRHAYPFVLQEPAEPDDIRPARRQPPPPAGLPLPQPPTKQSPLFASRLSRKWPAPHASFGSISCCIAAPPLGSTAWQGITLDSLNANRISCQPTADVRIR